MRASGLIVAVLVVLGVLAGPGGALPIVDPSGTWEGDRTLKLRAKGVAEKDTIPFLLTLGSARKWLGEDDDGLAIGGDWSRTQSGGLALALDDLGHASLKDEIERALSTEITFKRLKLKAKLRTAFLKVKVRAKFTYLLDGRLRRGSWVLKTQTYRTDDPNEGVDLVRQSQFRELESLMRASRSSHTSTLLDNGRVLLVGGYASGLIVNSSTELFDPETEEFFWGPSLNQARATHIALKLKSGDVLIAGGDRPASERAHDSAEIYEAASHTIRATAPMSEERTSHAATLLRDGRVLVTGGLTRNSTGTVFHRSAELFDPWTETWSPTANDMAMLRAGHRSTLLDNGDVLITGGSGNLVAEIFDPETGTFRTIEDRMKQVRSLHGAVSLGGGRVLLTDGGARTGEVFDAETETFRATGNQDSQQRSAAITFLCGPNKVLVIGGMDFSISFIHGSMEQFVMDYITGGRYFHIPALIGGKGVYLEDERAFAAYSRLADGRFLITGGLGEAFDEPDLRTAFVFDPEAE